MGVELARGRALPDILAGMKMVAEGVRTTRRRAGAGRASRRGAANRGAGRRAARGPQGRAHGALRADAPSAARRDRVDSNADECCFRPVPIRSPIDMGFFDKLRDGLSRTTQQIVSRFEEIVQQADAEEQRARPIDVDTIEALEELLISADVGIPATERIVTAVKDRARGGESLRDLVKQEIQRHLRRASRVRWRRTAIART